MSNLRLQQTFWIGISLLLAALALVFLLSVAQVQTKNPLPSLGQIGDFTLTNQDGKITTLADLTNHVWVADIIFTRCAGQCPRMTAHMKSVQDKLQKDARAKLVTLTTDPDYDSPEIMKRYGERFGADFNRWTFLTGTKNELANLGANSLKLSAQPIPVKDRTTPVDLFIHSTIFVVVDKHAQLRGIFETEGEGVDWTNDVEPRLIKTVHRLEREK
jgi:protein SCO1/2